MRTNTSGPWIPLRLTWRQTDEFNLQEVHGMERVRGYTVRTRGVSSSISASPLVQEQVSICGEDVLPENTEQVQFRWMNTVNQPGRRDMWSIYNVMANFLSLNGNTYEIFRAENSK